ncbi:hypothetical protein ACFE04_029567 [Oxalis oulophora]
MFSLSLLSHIICHRYPSTLCRSTTRFPTTAANNKSAASLPPRYLEDLILSLDSFNFDDNILNYDFVVVTVSKLVMYPSLKFILLDWRGHPVHQSQSPRRQLLRRSPLSAMHPSKSTRTENEILRHQNISSQPRCLLLHRLPVLTVLPTTERFKWWE